MTNEELKKKISEIALTELQVQFGCGDTVEVGDREACAENIADALIAAGIGDVREVEHRAEVYKRALHIAHTAGEFAYYVVQAEKELAEERKDD